MMTTHASAFWILYSVQITLNNRYWETSDECRSHAVISMCVEGKGPDDRVFTREVAIASAIFGKRGTKCGAMLGSAGWRVVSVG